MFVLAALPVQAEDTRPPPADELIAVEPLIPDAVFDIRYATTNNFMGEVMYPSATCLLRRAVVERLARAAALLRAQDRRLLIWDCYRPLSIQKKLWEKVKDPRYVANPKTGSRHNRGAAVDLAIVDKDGKAVTLPTEFDDFSRRAHRKRALKGDQGAEAKRLETAMKEAGFVPMATEWWHFDAPEAHDYKISDQPLEDGPQ